MSVEDNNKNQNAGSAPDGVPIGLLEDLDVVIENLSFIEDKLHQLQKRAQGTNEASLNYYLGMATQIAEQRLKEAKTQQRWLADE